jgi:colanic acid/amylovoran biosynthesis glycosyltransferase
MHECPAILEAPHVAAPTPGSGEPARVAYIMSRFPELTQTFVLFEILAVEQQGAQVELYPLLRGGNTARHSDGASIWRKCLELFGHRGAKQLMHPEAAPLVARAHYAPFLSLPILAAQLYYLIRRPGAYFSTIATIIRGAWGSPNFLLGGLALLPKAAYFARLMSAAGIEHIHAHFANHPATAALIIHRLTGIPFSFTAHGSDLHRDRRLLREKVTEAAWVVAISRYNREVIEQHCGPASEGRVAIIHCGVDTDVFRPGAPRAERPSQLQILSVGTLHEVKGQKFLVEACARLRDRGVNFRCQFVGEGPDRPALTAQIRQLGLESCVELVGQRTRSQIVALMQQADVVVAPSVPSQSGRREGIPVVLMEAMACGAPVVASDLSGIPELVKHEHSGLLTPPAYVAALADALARLQQDPDLCRRLGRGARATVMEEFNQQRNAAILVQRFRNSRRP